MRIRVIGIGTPFGDDAVGLAVARELRLPGVDTRLCRRPLDLVDALEGVDAAVLVDATRCGRPPGTVHEPDAADLREVRTLSSHGIGVCEALSLARALGRAPPRIALVGIEAELVDGDALSGPVRAALDEARERVRARCADVSAGDVDADGLPDLLIGAAHQDALANQPGKAYLIYGSTLAGAGSGVFDLSQADYGWVGEVNNDRFGDSVSGVGDVDGDLQDDVIVGAPQNADGGTTAGQSYLIYGSVL